ncbi:MAG: 5-formyltetrahydrofolate cyclo-ligase [Clostridia bacterium]|nr:5-formyltetrahydrofolate cyclo-ligase [Clostridia bacterium]
MPSSLTKTMLPKFRRDKKELRAHYRQIRKRISPQSRTLLNAALCSNLASLPCFREADTVLFYYPIHSEPNLLALAKHAQELGKRIAFPVSDEQTCTLTFRQVCCVESMRAGAYGIPEPTEADPLVTDFTHALCIVPALAFDPFGYRLGYGKGYYDRFLSHFDGCSVGVLFSCCLDDRLPRDAHDRPVDRIVTEKGGFDVK